MAFSLKVRDDRGFPSKSPLCRHDITSPFPPSGNGDYVRNLDVIIMLCFVLLCYVVLLMLHMLCYVTYVML